MRSSDPDTLSNRVVHVSVQLFSNEELASKMAQELHLLHVMVVSLRDMMSKILVPSTLQGNFRPLVCARVAFFTEIICIAFFPRSKEKLPFRSRLFTTCHERSLLLASGL